MRSIRLRQRYLALPQHAARLDQGYWAYPAIEQAYFCGNGLVELKREGRAARNLSNISASFEASRIGKAFRTAGNQTSYFTAPTVALTAFSMEVYYLPNAATSQYICGLQEDPNSATRDRELWIDDTGKFTFYIFDGVAKQAVSTSVAAAGVPVHLLGISDGVNIYLYVNGVLEATTAAGAAFTGYASPEFVIGSGKALQGSGWLGYAVYYNKALGATEAKERSRNKFLLLQQPVRRIWVQESLVAASAVQTNAGGTGAISQAHVLTFAPSVQDNIAAASAVVQHHMLIAAASSQSNAASAQGVHVLHFLTADNAQQANSGATGATTNGVSIEAALTTGVPSAEKIKKPGIPTGTDDWLKTMLEIMNGRRGNAIDPPKFQTLTFSATPTKAECEALYAYVNDVRRSVNSLITRFDT